MFKTVSALLVLVCLSSCQEATEVMRDKAQAWIGQPVSSYAETHSITPVSVYDNPSGERIFIFRQYAPLGSCGTTIKATKGKDEYYIKTFLTDCNPNYI